MAASSGVSRTVARNKMINSVEVFFLDFDLNRLPRTGMSFSNGTPELPFSCDCLMKPPSMMVSPSRTVRVEEAERWLTLGAD